MRVQLLHIIKEFFDLTNDQDPKTYMDNSVLLNVKCNLYFIIRLIVQQISPRKGAIVTNKSSYQCQKGNKL